MELEGIKLLSENYFFTANTIIIGLPGEIDDDVKETIEMIESLEEFPCIVIPLLYTDFKNSENSVSNKNLSQLQWELIYSCWVHNAKAVPKWTWDGTSRFNPSARLVVSIFARFGI